MTIEQAANLFAQNDVFRYIRDFYGIFHVEGDYAILYDIKSFLRSKGVTVKPRCQTRWFCNKCEHTVFGIELDTLSDKFTT